MKLFRFSATVTVSAFTDVVAETLEEAREIAGGRSASLATQHGDSEARQAWLISDADGEPTECELASVSDTDEVEGDTE